MPRRPIYDMYWRFASERQTVFDRRVAGDPSPWTEDPILREYKFCNVYRAADRVSQYLIRDVCYHDEPRDPEDRIFQIVAFRTFSKIGTWTAVRDFLGHHPTLNDLSDEGFRKALDHARLQNGRLYTGAFILCAKDAYGQPRKHLNHVELFRHMFLQDALGERILAASSLRQIYELLHGYPLMGDFMSYQIAIDLNYSDLVDFSENEFTQAGPGALRGINKVFETLGDHTPADIIHWMVDHQETAFESLGLPFRGLWGRPLHAIDCQGLVLRDRQVLPRSGTRAGQRTKAHQDEVRGQP
ncbi:MAG: nucleotide kinase domain-containing protein [Pseudonocardiaceae bacterium]